jgi:hypothetical protein
MDLIGARKDPNRQTAVRYLRIDDSKVVRLRAILEAYDGLAVVYGEGNGTVCVESPLSRRGELLSLLDDLQVELGFDEPD